MRYLTPVILAAAAFVPAAASAQTALTTTNYAQNFDTLANSGTSSTLPAGWVINETGTAANGTYAAGDGSSNTGNTYSFGTGTSTDRALGSLGSGSLESTYGVLFTNGLNSAITSLSLAYVGEQWRLGNSTDDGLTFQYSTNATSLTTGTWTTVSALNFLPAVTSGTQGALNGNLAINQRDLSAVINGLSIGAGATFGFRWVDLNSGGNDHGLAVDNFSLTATTGATGAVPEPATWGMIILGFGAMAGAVRRRGRVAQRVRFA